MGIGIESLFTSALGLLPPWAVGEVKLDTVKRRIDFEVSCQDARLACPHCGAAEQRIHDRLRRSWRHLDFFQFEAWLHADVPRVACTGRSKTTQMGVPWAREGSGFTALFETLVLAQCRELLMRQAAAMLRCADKQPWRRIEHYVDQARALDEVSTVKIVGVDDTSMHRGQSYITGVHDLDAKRLLFATPGRDQQTVVDFAADLKAHGGNPEQVLYGCQDMSAAYAKGVGMALRLKMALREVYAHAAASNQPVLAMKELKAWLTWARRSRLEPFKKLARTITERVDAVVRGMTDNRCNAFVEAMNGLLQQVKRTARGFRTAESFIATAYLRMSKLKHLPPHLFTSAQTN